MPWGAVVGAVASGVVNKAMSKGQDKNGGAGTQTVNKAPWQPAENWLKQNLATGQALQDQYMANPFSALQTAAYNNSNAQGDYMRNLVPSLLGQIQGQQVGFDRNNPLAKPTAFNYDDPTGAGLNQTSLLGLSNSSLNQDQLKADAAKYLAANAAPNEEVVEKDGKLYSLQKKIDPLGAKVTKALGLSKLF